MLIMIDSVNARYCDNIRKQDCLLTCECVHLVMSSCSCHKDDSHAIWSAISKNPMLHANLVASSVTEPELWSIEVLHCGNSDFRLFYSCDHYLDPKTFIYEL